LYECETWSVNLKEGHMPNIIMSRDRVTIDGLWIDYTSLSHRPVFSVTLLPTTDVRRLPGARPGRLATISRLTHTLTAHCRLTGLVQMAFLYNPCTDRIETTASIIADSLPSNDCFSGSVFLALSPHITIL
jgi:hypothetical protein